MLCPNCGATMSPTDERCPDCGARFHTPVPELPPARGPLRPLSAWAIGVYVGLGIAVAGEALLALLELRGTSEDLLVLVASGLMLAGFALTAAFLITWTYQARRNLELFAEAVPAEPVWKSVAGWFIPIGNLWMVPRVVGDLALNSNPATDSGLKPIDRSAVTWWWGVYIIGNVVTARFDSAVPGAAASLVAAALCVRMVRGITAAQASRQPKAWL